MIDGLKLTFSGGELRKLFDERIDDNQQRAERWTHEKSRTSEDETEDAPLLPEHMCANEAERHTWRAEVLEFIRDHVEPAETYRLTAADLEFGELLPSKPGWLEQEEYRNGPVSDSTSNGPQRPSTDSRRQRRMGCGTGMQKKLRRSRRESSRRPTNSEPRVLIPVTDRKSSWSSVSSLLLSAPGSQWVMAYTATFTPIA
jgi:hypothetical protein